MQHVQSIACLLTKHVEEPAQGGLAGDGFDAQHLAQRRITLQPSRAGELVRAAENAPDIPQRHIRGIVGVGTGRTVGQDLPQLSAKILLMQKVRPHDHAAMGGQTLIGERNPNGRSLIFGVNWQAHRLVRLPSRLVSLCLVHHPKPAKRCSLFQAESFRLRVWHIRPVYGVPYEIKTTINIQLFFDSGSIRLHGAHINM